jgi:hypothetical protein
MPQFKVIKTKVCEWNGSMAEKKLLKVQWMGDLNSRKVCGRDSSMGFPTAES